MDQPTAPLSQDVAQNARSPGVAVPRVVRLLLMAMIAGLLARVVLIFISEGTNDAPTFHHFGQYILEHGLFEMYRQLRWFNQPPLPAYWCAIVYTVSDSANLPFAPLFKVPNFLADLLIIALLWRIWKERQSAAPSDASRWPMLSLTAAAAYAWNLDAILVSAFHCNIDPLYSALCLLAVYLLETRRWNFAAGLAMGAALNVKLLPLILLPPLLISFRRVRPCAAFCAGLAVGIIPYLPVIVEIPLTFKKNVFSYRSTQDYWGISLFIHALGWIGASSRYVYQVLNDWALHGRTITMAVMLLIGLIARRRGWDRYTLCAVAVAAFLVITPGFGLQYTIFLVPFLCARFIGLSLIYGTIAGVLLAITYAWYLTRWMPLSSVHTGGLPPPAIVIGLVLWALLAVFVLRKVRYHRALE